MDAFMKSHKTRMAKALMLVVFPGLLFMSVLALSDMAQAASGRDSPSYAGRIWGSYADGVDWDDSLKEAGLLLLDDESMPDWLKDEVLDGSYLSGAISNRDLSIVYLSREGKVADVAADIDAALASNGWRRFQGEVKDGMDGVLAYGKQEGECSWLTTECIQAGSEATVVLHIERT